MKVVTGANNAALQLQHSNRLPLLLWDHESHTTMLLGAARALKESGDFSGTVRLIFQPAEEHGKGAIRMLDEGLFDRFPEDAVYGLHNMPWLEAGKFATNPGPIMGSEDNFVTKITGRGGHAAMPHNARDAITIGASIVTELQTIVARNVDPLHGAVVSCTEFPTDGTTNVIPTQVTIKGDTSSFLPEVSALIEQRMHRVAQGICDAHEAKLEFSYERVFLSTVNSRTEAGPPLFFDNGHGVLVNRLLAHKPRLRIARQ